MPKIKYIIFFLIGSAILTLIVNAPFLIGNWIDLENVNLEEVESKIFDLINDMRSNQGLPSLFYDEKLETIAKEWSNSLIKVGTLTHGDFEQRIDKIGYLMFQCGEIIAWQNGWTSTLAKDFVDGWIGSFEHYRIMITSSCGYMGVGVSRSGSEFYAVVDFRFI